MKNILKNCLNIIFLICFGYILYNAIFKNGVNLFLWNKYVVIIGVLVNIGILLLTYKYIDQKTKINTKILIPICLAIILVLQCIIGNLFRVLPNWDMKSLFDGAVSYINGDTNYLPYLYRYSNNIALQIVFIVLFKISDLIKTISHYDIAMLFNIIMIDIALVLTYLVSKKIFDSKKAFIIFLCIASMTPIYLFVPIIYTDTLSMLFPLLILYIYLTAKEKEKLNKKYALYILMAFAILIGISFKFTIIIVPIAITIYEMLNKNKKGIISIITIILIALIMFAIFRVVVIKTVFSLWNNEDYNNEKFPITHWLMMGLSDAGKYNDEDVQYTSSFTTIEEKKEKNIEVIKERIKNISLNSIRRKLMYTWGDGTYFAVNTLDYDAINEGLHQELVFKRGEHHEYYQYYTQIQHITIITLMIIVTLCSIKKEIDYIFILRLSIFGLFLFLLIWETRSRYLIHYLPIMQIIAFVGIEEIYNLIEKIKVRTKLKL